MTETAPNKTLEAMRRQGFVGCQGRCDEASALSPMIWGGRWKTRNHLCLPSCRFTLSKLLMPV